ENVIGEESTRFGDEHDFSFEVWHSHYDEETDDDVRELFVHDFDATVKVYKWNDDTEEYDLVDTIPVEISGGKIQAIDFSDMKVGQYKVTVTLDDPNYAFEEWDDDLSEDVDYAIRYFEIYQDNIHANVEGRDWTEYGQERIFKFDLTHWDDDAEEDVLFEYNTNAIVKVYKLTWDDEGVESAELIDTYSVAINDGHSEAIDLSDLNAGSYRVTIQLDDEDYALDYWFNGEYGIQEERFDVGRANVNITVEFDKDGYIYGDDVIVTVTITPQTTDEKLTEEIELNIMGKKSIKKHLVDGVATFTLEDYEAALYTIWVNFKGTDNYNDIYNYIDSFIIDKASPVINVSPRKDEYTYGEDVIIDVTLYDGDTGLTATAIVNVDSTDYVVNIENGEGTLTISGLAANENSYDIYASVAATDNYNGAGYDGDAKVVVNKATDAKLDVELVGDEIVVTLTGGDDTPLDGTVNLVIDDGTAIPVTITNGQGSYDASSLTAGTHTVEATSVADDNYESVSVSKEITKGSAPNEAIITVSVASIIYGQDAEIAVTLTDSEGNPVEGTLDVKVGETTKQVIIGTDGIGYVAFSDLTVGHYTATVSFAGDETYKPTSKEATFDVSKVGTVIESEDIVVTANVAGTMEFTLKDLNGNILAGRTVTLTFNGQTFERTSDEDGKFTVDINMANQGTYTISASYAGEADYEASTASYDVVVKPIATKLTVVDVTYGLSETKYLTATLTAGDEPLANKIVTFSLNGKTYTGRTNATGVVRIAVSLTAKKTYSVVASYGGDTTYGSAMAIYKLKVVKS
ncbi:Ig-like domain repeat protein, partial [Methanobrevibacter sp.]|uniref:Ig-like domain repeat protein n=1 Tax=Methanobrevibacter sp. TaxID=66852 RepID=UPI003890D113